MTRKRNLILIAVALVAVALVATNGSLVRGLFGQKAMLSLGGQQTQQSGTTATGGSTTTGQAQPGTGPAAAAAKATASVSVTPDTRDRGYVIDARLVSKSDGKPIANANIAIYDVVELLGTREMLIGNATTDGQGTVSITYKPSLSGAHQIIARATNAQLAAADGRTTFNATVIAPGTYARERLPLERFSVNLPMAGVVILLVIWGAFAFVVLGSLIRIPRGAQHEIPHVGRARELIGRNV